MDFYDLRISVSSEQPSAGEAEVEIALSFLAPSGVRSRVAIHTTVEHEASLSLETTRENAWRRARVLLREALGLTQTPAAALIAHKPNRERVARGEVTDDNIF